MKHLPLLVLPLALLFPLSDHTQRVHTRWRPVPPAAATAGEVSVLAGDTQERQREIFLLGYRALQENNRDSARAFFSRALEVYPLLADYSLYYLGILNHQAGQHAKARATFLRLLTDHPDSIWRGEAALEVATLALAEKNWAEAARYAEQARTSQPTPLAVRNRARLTLALAWEEQGNVHDAYRLYQALRRSAPLSPTAKTAKLRVEHLRAKVPERFALRTAQAYLDEMRLLAQEGDRTGVETLLQQFTPRFPVSRLQSQELSALARVHKQQGRTAEAAAAFRAVTARYPKSSSAAGALFEWARLLWNNDRDDEARSLFERFTRQYPRHRHAAEAWYAIGRIFQAHNQDNQATTAYQRLAELFPSSPLARDGRWRVGWMAYRRDDFRLAEKRFAALVRSAPHTSEGESARYWQARSAERWNRTTYAHQGYREILQRYPDGYYAVWAEKRLGMPPPSLELGTVTRTSPPPLSPQLERAYRRSQELGAMGLLNFARRELDSMRAAAPRSSVFTRFFLSEYSRLEGHNVALQLVQRLKGSRSRQRYLFPQAYWKMVRNHAQQKQLDPYLVLALMRQESLFDPEAVSPAQAYGLMQLLPTTAARLASVSPDQTLPLTDPALNIELGTTYLRQLLERYENNVIMALAAYNAGEKAVDKWRTRYPNAAPDEFVENISYRETRKYVKLVLRNYRTYRRLYGGESAMVSLGAGVL